MLKKLFFTAMVMLCLLTIQAQAGITNSGFETGSLSPWYNGIDISATELWNVTSADSHSGQYSATNVGNSQIRQDFAAVAVSDIVELSYWLKQPESAVSACYLYYSDGSMSSVYQHLSTSDWEYFNITSDLTAGKDLTGFSVWGYSGGGGAENRTYLDDVTLCVTAVPAPGAIIMASLGTGLVGFFKRRKTI